MTRNKEDARAFGRNVGRVVKMLAKAHDKPMTKVAADLGWSYSALNARLAGETEFLAREIRALAQYFDEEEGTFYRPPRQLLAVTSAVQAPSSHASSLWDPGRSGHVHKRATLVLPLAVPA